MHATCTVLLGMFFLTTPVRLHAQTAFNLKYGLVQLHFADENTGRHYGQSFGFDMIVEDSRVLFMPGVHYQQYAISPRTSRGGLFSDDNRFHRITVPMSIGTWLVGSRFAKLRIYGGGHLNFLIAVDNNTQGFTIDNVTIFQPGVQGGMQLMLWRFTIDVRYHHDFRNYIQRRAESKARGWEFLVGIAL